MAKVAYYPGCALEGTGGPYDKSTRAIVSALGLQMQYLDDYNCCGAMEVKNIHPMLQTYLSARNLALAALQRVLSQPEEGRVRTGHLRGIHAGGAGTGPEGQRPRLQGRRAYRSPARMAHGGTGARRHQATHQEKAERDQSMYTRPRQIFPEKDRGPGSESTYKPHYMDETWISP